mmetsp:Transcript_19275/g.39085  ORF Transcript_19275/g.39085 Transcript_19275/m.39085 type:complete len:274 (-) Transcript_19275:183-1004(-)
MEIYRNNMRSFRKNQTGALNSGSLSMPEMSQRKYLKASKQNINASMQNSTFENDLLEDFPHDSRRRSAQCFEDMQALEKRFVVFLHSQQFFGKKLLEDFPDNAGPEKMGSACRPGGISDLDGSDPMLSSHREAREDFPEEANQKRIMSTHIFGDRPELCGLTNQRPRYLGEMKGAVTRNLKMQMSFRPMTEKMTKERRASDSSCSLNKDDMVVYSPENGSESDFFDDSFAVVDGLITLSHPIEEEDERHHRRFSTAISTKEEMQRPRRKSSLL